MSYVVEENEYEANEWYLINTKVKNEFESGILEASPDYYKLAAKASKLNAGKQTTRLYMDNYGRIVTAKDLLREKKS